MSGIIPHFIFPLSLGYGVQITMLSSTTLRSGTVLNKPDSNKDNDEPQVPDFLHSLPFFDILGRSSVREEDSRGPHPTPVCWLMKKMLYKYKYFLSLSTLLHDLPVIWGVRKYRKFN